MDSVYGYEAVNVEAQSRSLSSLLSATKKLIGVRKSTLAFGRGSMTFIRPANRSVLAYVRQLGDEAILCVANLSRSAQATELDLSAFKDRVPLEMLGRTHFPAIGELPYMITLAPYGFYWFQLQHRDKSEPATPSIVPEFETLVVPVGATWVSLARTRSLFECDVLPGHLARSRWYPIHDAAAIHPTLTSAIPFCDIGDNRPWLAFFQAAEDDSKSRYVLPMQIEWVRFDRERYNPNALAAVRQGAREGTLLDVAADTIFIGLLLRNLAQTLTIEENGLKLEFRPTNKFAGKAVRQPERIGVLESAPFSSSVLVDSDYVVKLFRKLENGINPAIEIGRYLTDVAGFANAPAMLGSAELIEGETRNAIAVVHVQVGNQGDAWTMTAAYLDRLIEEQHLLAADGRHMREAEEQNAYMRHLSQIGRRAAELHMALAAASGSLDLTAEPVQPHDIARWTAAIVQSAEQVFQSLRQRRNSLSEADRAMIDELLAQQDKLHDRLNELMPPEMRSLNLRLHSDFHLGRVLIVKDDVFFTGFEGDVRRPLEERRRKAPAARDVASMIWSIEASSHAALGRAPYLAPDDTGRLGKALTEWVERATAAFMGPYRELMTDSSIWPADSRVMQRMVDFFLLEKAFDVLETELHQRVEAAPAVIARILRILSQPAREAA
jgi:maltose alpha-D-glucosyltransferase / alpha-amylase